MSVRRSLIILAFVTVALPFIIFGGQGQRTSTAVGAQFDNIQLYEVRSGDVTVAVNAVGTLQADQSIALSALVPGRVRRVFVSRDDYVLAGDVLLALDNTLQQIAYQQALLGIQRAELELRDLLTPDENALLLAQATVDSAWGAYISVQNAVSQDDIRAAELAYQQAYERYEILLQRRDTALPGTYEMLDAQTGEASFNAEIARLQVENLRNATLPQQYAAYNRVLQAQAELERVQAGPTEAQIATAELAIRQAEAQLERAEIAYNRTQISAPFDGVIAALNVEVGALVAPGAPVMELVDLDPLRLVVPVDEIDISQVRTGQGVRVELDALPGVFLPARVMAIALAGTQGAGIVTYDVNIALEEQDPRVRVGMTAEVTIVVEEKRDVLKVPNLYIRLDRASGEAFVNILRPDDTVEEIPIILGLRGVDESEVVAGLTEGDIIVISLGGGGIGRFLGN